MSAMIDQYFEIYEKKIQEYGDICMKLNYF